MSLTIPQIAHILVALSVLMIAAHGGGFVFARLRQPRVIGEIVGGLVLGPTLLGSLFPAASAFIFPTSDGATLPVLAAVYEIGLLLLMFCAGLEVKSTLLKGERRTALWIAASGTIFPFLLGLVLLRVGAVSGSTFLDMRRFYGSAASPTAFLLVFAIAIAVTSIPVISRILFDLKLLGTPFARIVLGAAVIEDILLYVVLAIAVGMVGSGTEEVFGLQAILGIPDASRAAKLYHILAPLSFIALSLSLGRRIFGRALSFRYNVLARSSPIAFLLVFMLSMTGLCVFLGVAPIFGAFVAGMVVGMRTSDPAAPGSTIKQFSFAFFIPVYFAIVGLRLDLARGFDVAYFLFLLAFACAAKSLSVYAGARLARESRAGAANLAVAMNARGGPGIVLASVALDTGIVDGSFYSKLVMLAVVTSMAAGAWLERVVARGAPLR